VGDYYLWGGGSVCATRTLSGMESTGLPHERPVREVSCRDPIWALVFLIHFAFIVWLALAAGVPMVRSGAAPANDAAALAIQYAAGSLRLDSSAILSGIAIAVGAAAVSGLVMLILLQKLAGFLIRASFFFAMAALAAGAAVLFAYSLLAPAVILALLFLLVLGWYTCIRHRIDFAAAHVDVAVAALRSAPTLICVALGALAVQGGWGVFWGLSAMGAGGFYAGSNATLTAAAVPQVAAAAYGAPSANAVAAVFCMLLSFFWVTMLIKDVVAFCAASVTGDWWFKGDKERHPVAGALRHAVTTSCGTLSLAALLVAVVQAARTLYNLAVKRARDRGGGACSRNPCMCVWSCLVGCVLAVAQWLISWANSWAVVFAALTGQNFYQSGLAAMALFRARGWEAVINQDLVAVALRVAALVSACVGAVAGGMATYAILDRPGVLNRTQQATVAACLCFFVGAAMSTVLTSLLLSSTRAVFAAWAMSPHALATTHPQHAAKLADAWKKCHPEACKLWAPALCQQRAHTNTHTHHHHHQHQHHHFLQGRPAGTAVSPAATAGSRARLRWFRTQCRA
jgi:hypothetical protein